jgi:CubicO group peptidase (beta-lactamase class C family)
MHGCVRAIALVCLALAVSPLAPSAATPGALDEAIPRLMEEAGVPGLSAALIEDGRVVWTGAFGVRTAETGEPVDGETMFEAASMTKPVCAYAALRMVGRGELALDAPLHTYLREERFPQTDRYEALTARHVLTHTTGLPNWGVELLADPGERFGYSGEGFAYLGRVMAAISGLPLNELIEREVYEPLGMERSSMVWSELAEANGTTGHDRHGFALDRRTMTVPNAGSSMLTTATDYSAFLAAVMNGTGLTEETAAAMLELQVQALDWRSGEPYDGIWWGLGWGLQPAGDGHAFWHWGNNVDVRGYATADPASGRGFVYFANSENGHALARELLGIAVPDAQRALDWLGEPAYDDPDRRLLLEVESAYMDGGVEAGRARLADARAAAPDVADDNFLEEVSRYLSSRELDAETLDVLDLWVSACPDSLEAYTHRASHHFGAGRLEEALADYREVERLGAGREGTAGMATWVSELIQSVENPMCMPDYILSRFVGDYGPRHIRLRDHRIYYQRDGRQEYLLSAMDEDTFRLEGIDYFRLRFVTEDDEGPATKVIGLYMDGRRDESLRDPEPSGQ